MEISVPERAERKGLMDSSEVVVAVGSFVIHQCLFRALEHTTKVRALYRVLQAQNSAKSGKRAGDAAPAEARAEKSSEDEKKARDDCKRLWSCYLSHMHCVVTLGSCLWFWASRPVDVYSPSYMVEVRAPVLSHVPQRRELAAAVTGHRTIASAHARAHACMHAHGHAPHPTTISRAPPFAHGARAFDRIQIA